jgi:hypothetical protein
MKLNRIGIPILGLLLIQFGCEKKGTAPQSGKTCLRFEVVYGSSPQSDMIASFTANGMDDLTKAVSASSYYNMARVFMVDLSGYHVRDATEFLQTTEDGKAYVHARDEWKGDQGSYSAWKGFIGGFFNIIVDQNLTLTEDHALGVVNGVVGLNHIMLALTDGDKIVYWGEQSVTAVEGEVNTVHISVFLVDFGDPCLTKPMDKSPEEAVFNAAFGN